ncbi:MAG: PmoA family protein [Pirellulales bacterium]
MSKSSACLVLLAFMLVGHRWQRSAAAEPAVQFEQHDNRLQVIVGGQPLATYVWRDPDIQRPYMAHVRTLSGVQVSRNHPPVEGADRTDHATFHPGLWMAFGDISGADFWRNKASVIHKGFSEAPHADGRSGGFAVKNAYVSEGKTLCTETCRVRFELRPGGTIITWDSSFTGESEFAFGDQEEMGLGVRVATPLAVKSGGRIVDNENRANEAQVWGKTAEWCDASGTIDGQDVGVTLMSDPKNFRRPWIHARDYGLLVANPFGEKAFTQGPKSRVVVRPGETLRLRFGVFVHAGKIDLAAAYSEWVAALPPRE